MYSIKYWQNRYLNLNGHSGSGSKGKLLTYKTNFINNFIENNKIKSVTDFGHGDLEVAKKIKIEEYTGIDIFDGSKFNFNNLKLINCKFDEYNGAQTDLVICLDVLYHILEDEQDYLIRSINKIIDTASKYIIIYSQNSRFNNGFKGHTYDCNWLQIFNDNKNVKLIYEQTKPEPGTAAKFFIFEKI